MSSTTPNVQPVNRLVLHHLNNSRSQRVLWLLEELEVPYEIKFYQRTPQMLAPKELKQVHPLGKAPILTDGDMAIAESGAIVEYLIERYGNGRAKAPAEGWIDNLYFTHYAEGTFMPLLQWKLVMTVVPDRAPLLIRPVARVIGNGVIKSLIDPQLKTNLQLVDNQLQKHPGKWIAGGEEPTSADFMMLFAVETLASRVLEVPESIKAYVALIHNRPAYKRALEKGGPYDYA
ncbi:hypothetical protein FRC02_008147 [Tulasnella sp. 418]|nr:hypothetical protein FRC02_008147 [Tulasnella sp. 418]